VSVTNEREKKLVPLAKAQRTRETFTAEDAEHAESKMETLMLHLSDLCVFYGKISETRS
jgi:hypothetical protein